MPFISSTINISGEAGGARRPAVDHQVRFGQQYCRIGIASPRAQPRRQDRKRDAWRDRSGGTVRRRPGRPREKSGRRCALAQRAGVRRTGEPAHEHHDHAQHHAHRSHETGITSFVLAFDEPLDWMAFRTGSRICAARAARTCCGSRAFSISRRADAGSDPRRPPCLPSAGGAPRMARRRPPLAHRVHHPRHRAPRGARAMAGSRAAA